MIHDIVGELVVGLLDSLVDFLPHRMRWSLLGLCVPAVIGMIVWLIWLPA